MKYDAFVKSPSQRHSGERRSPEPPDNTVERTGKCRRTCPCVGIKTVSGLKLDLRSECSTLFVLEGETYEYYQ